MVGGKNDDNLKALVEYADRFVKKNYPHSLNFLSKSAGWRKNPATEKQLKILKKFKITTDGITKGEASNIIGKLMQGRR
jgi:ATP-dependent helicase IRC3